MKAYRICPCPMFDIAGTQRWLEQMSAKGYHIDTAFNWRIVGFEKGVPKAVRYRLDAAPDWGMGTNRGTPSPDQGTGLAYQEMGWKYVSNRNHFHIYMAEDPAAPELHTDPRVQALSLQIVRKRLFRDILGILPLVFLWLWNLAVYEAYDALVAGAVIFPGVMALAYATNVLKTGTEFLWVRKHQKQLNQGQPIRPYSSSARLLALALEIVFVLLIGLMLSSLGPSARDQAESVPMEEYTGVLEVPRVEELFPGAEITSLGSEVCSWTTAASPENYRLQQRFRLTLPDGTEVSGIWTVTRCETAAGWIARGYAEECVAHDKRRYTVEALPLETALDFAAAYRVTLHHLQEPNSPTIILCQDNVVLTASLNCGNSAEPPDYRQIAAVLAGCMK